MNPTPQISIIVPIYNAADYLAKSIDSIIDQDFTDFELLLINDGSSDRSGEMCENYAKQDARVKVFNKANGGVSSARNLGLDHVKGKWVCFVDGDDYLSPKALSVMIDKTVSNDVDVICFNNYFIDSYGQIASITKVASETIISANDTVKNLLLYATTTMPWGKFYKREILAGHKFDKDLRVAEDLLFQATVLLNKPSVRILDCTEFFYYYRVWHGSAMAKADHNYNLLNSKIKTVLESTKNFELFEVEYAAFVFLNLFFKITMRDNGNLSREDYELFLSTIKTAYQARQQMKLKHKMAILSYKTNRTVGNVYSRLFCFAKSKLGSE